MAKKISGKPRFDMMQIMKVAIDRGANNDRIEADVVFIDSKLPPGENMCGAFKINSGLSHTSKKTQELTAKLIASLEEDAARLLFNEPSEEGQDQEGLHVDEPQGIAEQEAEDSQI